MRFKVETALALAVLLLVNAGLARGQKVLEENPYYLRADKRLQVTLNVEAEHPKLAQIVASLRDVTGLDLTVDASLQDHEPDYGVILPSKKGYHAWQLMEMVAKRGLEYGYWEKTDQGYRLKGELKGDSVTAVAQSPPDEERPRLSLKWLLGIGGALLVLLLVLMALRQRGAWIARRASARPNSVPIVPAPETPRAGSEALP